MIGKFKRETPKNVFIDEFICLGSQAYSLKCGCDDRKKLKSISECQSKSNKIEENYNCLYGGKQKRNVLFIVFDELIMKYIFKKYT